MYVIAEGRYQHNQMNNCRIVTETGQVLKASRWGLNHNINNSSFSASIHLSPYNQRITVVKYKCQNESGLLNMANHLDKLAIDNNFEKIWLKASENDAATLVEHGFIHEAAIDNYFGSEKKAVICAKFYNNRSQSKTEKENLEVINFIKNIAPEPPQTKLPAGYTFKLAEKSDLSALADLYKQVFQYYPYPINNTQYLESILGDTIFGLVYNGDMLVASASAEVNWQLKNAEMTDFATLPEEQGKRLASIILNNLDMEMSRLQIKCLYTIARSTSMGMNLVFARAGYYYTGTLINNCVIGTGYEDMNVFCKSTY